MPGFAALIAGLLLAFQLWAAAPDMRMEDVHGEVHQLSDYRGKWVVVNYWATWCPPCLGEIPELAKFHREHKKDAVVLGINYEEVDRELLLQFIEDYAINYPVLVSSPEEEALGPIPGLPSTFLVRPDGRIAARRVGPVTAEEIEGFIADQSK